MKKVPRKEVAVCMADTLMHNVTLQVSKHQPYHT